MVEDLRGKMHKKVVLTVVLQKSNAMEKQSYTNSDFIAMIVVTHFSGRGVAFR